MMTRFRLTYQRYEEIKKVVIAKLQEWGIDRLPFDCFLLCEKLGIVLKKYYDQDSITLQNLLARSEDAFCFVAVNDEGYSYFTIVYNDHKPKHRIRFSIMHEIGHIVLDHSEHSTLAETEANFFAQYMLVPIPILQYHQPLSSPKISSLYNISEECANNILIQYRNWKEKGCPELFPYEASLLRYFHYL